MADAKITRLGRLQPQHGFLPNLQLSIACSKDTDVAGGYMAAQQNGASGKAGCRRRRSRHGHGYTRGADAVRQAGCKCGGQGMVVLKKEPLAACMCLWTCSHDKFDSGSVLELMPA